MRSLSFGTLLFSRNADVTVELHVERRGQRVVTVLGGQGIPTETAERLCCDASVREISHNTDGSIYDVGRKTRQVPEGLRRQLEHRDKGCAFPGCDRQAWLHAHHIRQWIRDHGPTNLNNLVLLCYHHHHLMHEGHWTVEHHNNGHFTFRDPTGKPIQKSANTNPPSQLPNINPPPNKHDGTNLNLNYVVDTLIHITKHRKQQREKEGSAQNAAT